MVLDPVSTAAIGWAFSAAGWLISPVLSRLLNQCFDALGKSQSEKQTLFKKVEKLETVLLPQLLILTEAARESPHRGRLESWLKKLKSAFYEAEHLLGLVEYECLEKKVNSLFPSPSISKFTVKKLKDKLLKSSSDKENLVKSLENLEEIVDEAMEFVPLLNLPSSRVSNPNSIPLEQLRESSSIRSSTVIGRDEDRDYIVKLLRENEYYHYSALTHLWKCFWNILSRMINGVLMLIFGKLVLTFLAEHTFYLLSFIIRSKMFQYFFSNKIWCTGAKLRVNPLELTSKCYSVIGIWGMGGSGKTTLAQYVCDYEKNTFPKYFDHIIWVHVSEKFSVHTILKKILESVSKEPCPNYSSLEGLHSKLVEKLRGRRFLLVLDDVWCDKRVSEQEFDHLFAPLQAGKRGSKILVTTRIEEAVKALGCMNPIPLRELDEDQFFSLLMSNALGDAQIRDNHLKERLTLIGKKIAAKLFRSPLAAKTVAGQLRIRLNAEFWSYMLESSLLNDAIGALLLSYRHLPPPLQRCFAISSLFPKGHYYTQDDLVNLWIAEGFIETGNGKEHMMDIGNRYILELISGCFFQYDASKIYFNYYVHDLMHDLAEYVSEGEFFRLESGEEKEIPHHTRHIFVVGDVLGKFVDKISRLKNLRTIIVSGSYSDSSLKEVNLETLFAKLRKLWVLQIKGIEFKRVHKFAVHWKNLRYLKFEEAKEDSNFDLLNELYQLRILDTNNQIPNVGRLISLQHFQKFYIRKGKGFELKQLEHLQDLYGSLYIYGLDVVNSKEEAQRAKLSEKMNLHRLYYQWNTKIGNSVLRENDAQILDGLCPPPQIKNLKFNGYSGGRLPSWILENNSNVIHLEDLTLDHCQYLETLPKINELSNLLYLEISYVPRLKSWGPLPLSLTKLKLFNCVSLSFVLNEDLEKIIAERRTWKFQLVTILENCRGGIHDHVQFQRLQIEEMMKMGDQVDEASLSTISTDMECCIEKRLDLVCQLTNAYGDMYLPLALKYLTITSCYITDKVFAVSLQKHNSLTDLYLDDIITLTCISNDVLSSLTSLRVLVIRECLLLMSIGGWDTHGTLEKLEIQYCSSLILKPSVVANSCDTAKSTSSSRRKKAGSSVLKDVSLQGCIPEVYVFQNLISIESITVMDCPTIVNLHIGYLDSLVSLELNGCRNLISLSGLTKLNNLKQLRIIDCKKAHCNADADKLPQLKELTINKLSRLEQLISKDGLSSLVALELIEAQEEYFSQQDCEVLCYLSSLETICFWNCNMRSLPNLQCLHSLKHLDIGWCENLTSLPELPRSVQGISISYCNEEFMRNCKDTNHLNGRKISYIPNNRI